MHCGRSHKHADPWWRAAQGIIGKLDTRGGFRLFRDKGKPHGVIPYHGITESRRKKSIPHCGLPRELCFRTKGRVEKCRAGSASQRRSRMIIKIAPGWGLVRKGHVKLLLNVAPLPKAVWLRITRAIAFAARRCAPDARVCRL